MTRVRKLLVAIVLVVVVAAIVVSLVILIRAPRSRAIVSLAGSDAEALVALAQGPGGDDARRLSVRQELLLPRPTGRPLADHEECVEVWLDERQVGWIYVEVSGERLRRTGWRQDGAVAVERTGAWRELRSIATDAARTDLIDGREAR